VPRILSSHVTTFNQDNIDGNRDFFAEGLVVNEFCSKVVRSLPVTCVGKSIFKCHQNILNSLFANLIRLYLRVQAFLLGTDRGTLNSYSSMQLLYHTVTLFFF
jgi:hypothetical protein